MNRELTALILAGGLGTRLRQIDGEPFLILLLRMLADKGFTHAVLATGYMGDKIQDVVGSALRELKSNFPMKLSR